METAKLIFNVKDLPGGRSTQTVQLEPKEVELDDTATFNGGSVEMEFYKTDHFVEVKFNIAAKAELICDRSLQSFNKDLSGAYYIYFDPNPVEESETARGSVKQISSVDLSMDISKEVRDTMMLDIPIKKIHPDFLDSEGNPIEFELQKFGDQADNENNIDPRWAALKKLK
ncbi:MAG: DUF177 domain-containing protein [Balneolaceae bacterium]|nr:DUF177 domain-containing protein [Balneolaceae bacterium]